jgi:hypothetical protein
MNKAASETQFATLTLGAERLGRRHDATAPSQQPDAKAQLFVFPQGSSK